MVASQHIHIELFGAPRVLLGNTPVRLPARKSLAILAYLAIEGRVTRAKLAALFWAEADEQAARRNLRRELHRLRESGLETAVLSESGVLRLADSVRTDVAGFESDLAAGRPQDAVARYAGPLLDGFAVADAPSFDDWAAQQAEHYAQRWRSAALGRAAELEADGELHAALALHQRLLADDGLHEQHHRDVMRLHHRLGDRAAALAQYERCRTVLRDELGLAPLPETVGLAADISTAAALATAPPSATAPGIGHLGAPFVAREAELAALNTARYAAQLITGDPGVGKSRLAMEFVGGDGTCTVRFTEIARQTPLSPYADLLRTAWATPGTRARLAALDAAAIAELSRLLPELSAGAAGRPREEASPSPERRARFLASVARAVAAVAGDGVLLIEDLHWADEASVELTTMLVHRRSRLAQGTPRIVATARTQELADHPLLRQTVRALERGGLLQCVAIGPLDEAGVIALVQAMAGADPGGNAGVLFARRLARSTGGNPFFLFESIRHLFDIGELALNASGEWSTRHDETTADYAELPLPPSVQDVVLERVERLGAPARRVLEAASLTDVGFTLAEVQPATALSDFESVDGLERAVQAQLLTRVARPEDEGDSHGYRFAHELVRQAIDANLGAERRRLIHARLAHALQALKAPAARIAHHLESAGDRAAALPWRMAAAEQAARVFDTRRALDHLTRALALDPSAAQQAEIRRARVQLLRLLHELPAAHDEIEALAALGRELQQPALAAEVLCGRAALALQQQRYADAVEFAEAAVRHPAIGQVPPACSERLPLDHAFALVERARYEEARAIYERELAAATTRSPGFRAELHYGLANYYTSFARDAEAREHVRHALQLAREAGAVQRELRALSLLAYTEFQLGDTPRAIELMDAALAEAERLDLVTALRNTLTNFIAYLLPAGQIERAQAVHARAVQLLAFAEDPATRARLLIRETEIATYLGQVGPALRSIREAIELIERNSGGFPDFHAWYLRGRLLWWCGDFDTPAALYRGLRESPAWLPTSETPVRLFSLAFSLNGDPAAARAASEELAAIQPAPGLLCHRESIDFWRAHALLAAGEPGQALALLEPPGGMPRLPAFGEHRARYLALRVAARAALASDIEPLRSETEALLHVVPAPVVLELAAAWAAAAPHEPQWQALARAKARAMHDSLHTDPELQQRFRGRWHRLMD